MTITIKSIRNRIDYINDMLEDLQSDERLQLDNAYRLFTLEVIDAGGALRRTLIAHQTKKQLHDLLYMMEQMLWMVPVTQGDHSYLPYQSAYS